MKDIIHNLLALQKLELSTTPLTAQDEAAIAGLRALVPKPVLEHYDRLIARGKKGVAMVRGTSCGECHLSIPTGTLHALPHQNDIHLCDNCGRYLCLPDPVPAIVVTAPPVKATRRYVRKSVAITAAAA
ncbi:MAG TPA: C4-type zinc ribbon domain-containing protein [Verrucomicrobiae bacterium]|jgi:hypothetical protein|nr:C4-type zinc ribbon domain-containing protein [Verrucomicrobiae bacterium]